ncbi:MAG: hypothetical protein ACLS48_10850 [[Eubacterium] siraeum]
MPFSANATLPTGIFRLIDLLDEAAACASINSKELTEYEQLKKKNKALETEENNLSAETENKDYQRIAEIKTELAKNTARIDELEPMIKEVHVTENDVCKVIELWTGIPASKLLETEFKRIANLETVLKSKVVGQDEACELVAAAIKNSSSAFRTSQTCVIHFRRTLFMSARPSL